MCSSAQPGEPDSMVFGVITQANERRRVGYLTEPQPANEVLLALVEPALPTEIFRLAAPCATHTWGHFAGGSCKLASRTGKNTSPVVDRLPPCRIRPTCRWFLQEGRQACVRCPQVVTYVRDTSDEWREIAMPSKPDQPSAV